MCAPFSYSLWIVFVRNNRLGVDVWSHCWKFQKWSKKYWNMSGIINLLFWNNLNPPKKNHEYINETKNSQIIRICLPYFGLCFIVFIKYYLRPQFSKVLRSFMHSRRTRQTSIFLIGFAPAEDDFHTRQQRPKKRGL